MAGRSQPSPTPSHAPTARGGPQPPAGARLNPTCGPEVPTPSGRGSGSASHRPRPGFGPPPPPRRPRLHLRARPRGAGPQAARDISQQAGRGGRQRAEQGIDAPAAAGARAGLSVTLTPSSNRATRFATGRLRPIQRGVRLLQQLLGCGLWPGRRPPSPGAPRQHATRSASGMTSPPPPVHDRRPPARSGGAAPAIPARTPRPVAVDIAHGQTAMTGGGALPPHARQRRVAHAGVVDHQRVPLARGGGHRVLGQQPHPPVVEHLVIQSRFQE